MSSKRTLKAREFHAHFQISEINHIHASPTSRVYCQWKLRGATPNSGCTHPVRVADSQVKIRDVFPFDIHIHSHKSTRNSASSDSEDDDPIGSSLDRSSILAAPQSTSAAPPLDPMEARLRLRPTFLHIEVRRTAPLASKGPKFEVVGAARIDLASYAGRGTVSDVRLLQRCQTNTMLNFTVRLSLTAGDCIFIPTRDASAASSTSVSATGPLGLLVEDEAQATAAAAAAAADPSSLRTFDNTTSRGEWIKSRGAPGAGGNGSGTMDSTDEARITSYRREVSNISTYVDPVYTYDRVDSANSNVLARGLSSSSATTHNPTASKPSLATSSISAPQQAVFDRLVQLNERERIPLAIFKSRVPEFDAVEELLHGFEEIIDGFRFRRDKKRGGGGPGPGPGGGTGTGEGVSFAGGTKGAAGKVGGIVSKSGRVGVPQSSRWGGLDMEELLESRNKPGWNSM